MIGHPSEDHGVKAESVADHKDDVHEPPLRRVRGCGWWRHRSGLEQLLTVLVVALLVACGLLVALPFVTGGLSGLSADAVCQSEECIVSAARLLQRLDTDVAPCDDFYSFACGGYLKRHAVPDDHHLSSTLQRMQDDLYIHLKKLVEEPAADDDSQASRKIKRFYSSCMNTSGINGGSASTLRALLEGVGKWPLLETSWDEPSLDLEQRLAALHVRQVRPFVQAFVAPDDHDASSRLLHIYSGGPILRAQYYLDAASPDHVRYLLSYRGLIAGTARLLRAPEQALGRDLDDLLRFEAEFANISIEDSSDPLNETSVDDDFVFNKVNVSTLEEMVPEIKWGMMLKYIFDSVGMTTNPPELRIVLHCERYLRHLVELLSRTSPRTVVNYLTWRFVAKHLPYLDIHFRRLYADFRREVPHPSEERVFLVRWKECVRLVHDGFGMALASMYVRRHHDLGIGNEVEELTVTLKETFIQSIHKQDWLDTDTKKLCEEKVRAMATKIGFPRYILDPKQLDADYSELEVSEDRFLNNILEMRRFEVARELTKVIRPVDKDRDWYVQPLIVNAFYEATGNAVIFPIGILRRPIYTLNRPKYLNYGTLGVVIGHEITHGFDNSGRKFDKVGNMSQWWPEEVVQRFKQRATCFVDQYSQLPIDMVGQNVNGNHTLDDNICDNSGLQQAYRAFRKHVSTHGEEPRLPGLTFSNQQVFFLQFAQIWCEVVSKEGNEKYIKDYHSPGKYRANIPLMNTPEFAETFQCPSGSAMNPPQKCSLWG